jgi:methylmalonyl-CoA mutase cobalamin-binding subunit
MVISEVLKSLDIEVVDLGSSVEADTVIDEANKHKPDAIVISTYNGLALTYGKSLLANAQKHQLETPIFMGGRLNEDTGEELPIDVTEDLKEIGIIISGTLNNMIQTLGQLNATN